MDIGYKTKNQKRTGHTAKESRDVSQLKVFLNSSVVISVPLRAHVKGFIPPANHPKFTRLILDGHFPSMLYNLKNISVSRRLHR